MGMERQNGFTLVELLVTIVVVTLLLAMGIPSMGDFTRNNRITAQSNGFVAAIQLARSEAVKRGANTAVCVSVDQATCSNDNTKWASGWLVFSDLNLNGAPDVGGALPLCEDTEDCVMRTSTGLSNGSTMATGSIIARFAPTGLSNNGGTVDFTLAAKDCQRSQARRVRITPQGHTIVTTIACP